MAKKEGWMQDSMNLEAELFQGMDEGKDVDRYRSIVKAIIEMADTDPDKEKRAGEVFDELQLLPSVSGLAYHEPSGLEGIKLARPSQNAGISEYAFEADGDKRYEKIYGAWLGRCAGCLLGKPVEGWSREKIQSFALETGSNPYEFYFSSAQTEGIRKKYKIVDFPVYGGTTFNAGWINHAPYMVEDDDMNYPAMNLKILENYGSDFTPDDVAECWLMNMPLYRPCGAEKLAYKNVAAGKWPPVSAFFRNPYREHIGAQIRGDLFGYINPGQPEKAAAMAWRDASISHLKNGIYGEMFIAAMISVAAVSNDIVKIINIGLAQIPEYSRLAEKIKEVLSWQTHGLSLEQAVDRLHGSYDERIPHHWCHVIPNAMIVCLALLYGGLDFQRSIAIAITSGFDTDCNGATVGSIVGMITEARNFPEKLMKPLNDKVATCVSGFELTNISELACRTVSISLCD